MTLSHHHLNIHRVYSQANADEINNGLTWYAQCREDAARMLPGNIERAAAVIAALSPGVKFEYNLLAAEALIAGQSLDGYGIRWRLNITKARKILAGASPLSVLRGLKVTAFFACIVDPSTDTVCVDSHAYGVWCGRYHRGDDVPHLDRRNRYERIASDYQAVAKDLNIAASQLQAICWIVWRRLHDVQGGSVPF